MRIKRLACELPAEHGLPFARFSAHGVAHAAVERGIGAAVSDATVWRWLHADADRYEPRSGIVPFDRLVADVMTQGPYASARRVFWVVDNGFSHRGERSARRLAKRWPNLAHALNNTSPNF